MSTTTLAPTTPFQPYASLFQKPNGPGDARPTAQQIILDSFPLPTTATALKGRVILITGASSGIGVETARALYSAGAELYLGARDLGKLQGVIDDIVSTHKNQDEGNSYTPPVPQKLELHLDSLSQIRSAAADFLKRSNNTLHILINNAGVMACPLNRTKDGFEMQFGTNHLGHFLLYTLLEPALLSSAEKSNHLSRVINLSSAGHRMSTVRFPDWNYTANTTTTSGEQQAEENPDYQKWAAYGQSKTANIWMASAIQRRHGSGKKPLITALSVHPGGIQTELGRHMDESDYERLNLKDFAPQYKSIPQGAATTVWAAVAEHFASGENGGRYLEDCGEAGPKQSETLLRGGFEAWAYDEEGSERLWRESEEAVKA